MNGVENAKDVLVGAVAGFGALFTSLKMIGTRIKRNEDEIKLVRETRVTKDMCDARIDAIKESSSRVENAVFKLADETKGQAVQMGIVGQKLEDQAKEFKGLREHVIRMNTLGKRGTE